MGKRKTGTEFFHAEGVFALPSCAAGHLSMWSASSYYEDLNGGEAGELQERSNAGQDHCVGEGDGDGGGGEGEAV